MKVVTFGASVIDAAIITSKSKIQNELRMCGISPFSFISDMFDIPIASRFTKEKNTYKEKMALLDANKQIVQEVNRISPELFIIDFYDESTKFLEWKLSNGKMYRLTYSETIINELDSIRKGIEKAFSSTITSEEVIDPRQWSEKRISEEIYNLVQYLKQFKKSIKVVLVELYAPYHKIENGIIEKRDKIDDIMKKNNQIRLFLNCFKRYYLCLVVEQLESLFSIRNFFPDALYGYLCASFCAIGKDEIEKMPMIKKQYIDVLEDEIAICNLNDVICRYRELINQKEIVVLGPKTIVNTQLYSNIPKRKCIEYNKDIDIYNVINNINEMNGAVQEKVFILTNIYRDDILKELWKINIYEGKNLLLPIHEMISLRNFRGVYEDVYNNYVSSEREVNIDIGGYAATANILKVGKINDKMSINLATQVVLKVEEEVWSDKISIGLLCGSCLSIGKSTTFADNCHIRVQPYMSVFIEQDCMFSTEVFLFCGDGHGIYAIETQEKKNHIPAMIEDMKSKIVIGKHVWVGYQVTVLAGTQIGEGSIVGARSVVSSAYPNNCIIAGNRAKLIRKNIAWSRDPFVNDIYSEQLMLNELRCIDFTK